MLTDAGLPVPTRLREILADWTAAGRPPQGGMRWSRTTWQETLPDHTSLFTALPDRIDRVVVARQAGGTVHGEDDAVRAFVTAMVWGYGPVGYGAFRTARILGENPQAPAVLWEAAQRTIRDGGPDTFDWLSRHRLRGLGVAFATKYLFFCGGPDAPPALVLDRLVQRWLRRHAGSLIRLNWRVEDYRRYVQLATTWAGALGVTANDIEYLMFADAASADSIPPWSPPPSYTENESTVDAEAVAVLDALEEAATAFVAMRSDICWPDLDEFEHGLQNLRRIVHDRIRSTPTTPE